MAEIDIQIRAAAAADSSRLIDIWRGSVRATHGFLTQDDFDQIDAELRERYFPVASLWVATDGRRRPVGFIGLTESHIDTLFIDPAWRGKGVGRRLIAHAIRLRGALTVEVNEQNPQAVAFYQRMGFATARRSALDGAGRPYPLLYMSRPAASASSGAAPVRTGRQP
ncbi:acetyltransferase [Affinibrenneria salicis]|uniref:Acetyltransferase n=1 Tax=Affinibrenneria salicis TaxID=2590031 RepID=A0A5J5FYY3_9GAMM|nr:acetyltransferase [Affinibrenneria salicis]KAA8998417.1 acetyltransferase [Affinibrenneria salicis]